MPLIPESELPDWKLLKDVLSRLSYEDLLIYATVQACGVSIQGMVLHILGIGSSAHANITVKNGSEEDMRRAEELSLQVQQAVTEIRVRRN